MIARGDPSAIKTTSENIMRFIIGNGGNDALSRVGPRDVCHLTKSVPLISDRSHLRLRDAEIVLGD